MRNTHAELDGIFGAVSVATKWKELCGGMKKHKKV